MKRRLEIARGLVHHPKILFLDEPTVGLDPQTRNSMWDYIKKLSRKENMTVFFTTHYMEEAEELCDRVAIMDRGTIIANAPPQQLINTLVSNGFTKDRIERLANLEDVFLSLTGHSLREE